MVRLPLVQRDTIRPGESKLFPKRPLDSGDCAEIGSLRTRVWSGPAS